MEKNFPGWAPYWYVNTWDTIMYAMLWDMLSHDLPLQVILLANHGTYFSCMLAAGWISLKPVWGNHWEQSWVSSCFPFCPFITAAVAVNNTRAVSNGFMQRLLSSLLLKWLLLPSTASPVYRGRLYVLVSFLSLQHGKNLFLRHACCQQACPLTWYPRLISWMFVLGFTLMYFSQLLKHIDLPFY